MKLIPRSQINIPKARQRQEFDPTAMQELKESIIDFGVMHPPVIRYVGGVPTLAAGERRIRCMEEIWELGGTFNCDGAAVPTGMIPCTNIGDLTELEAEEAELDENIKRKDLTWQEQAAAMQKLNSLRTRQAAAAGTKPPTVADLAMEVKGRSDGDFQAVVRKELIVARHLDNPIIAKAKTTDEAFKILKRAEQAEKHRELAEIVGATFTADVHRIEQAEACAFMRTLTPGTVDVILTDPPYGMGADSFGDGAGKLSGIEHHYDDSYEAWQQLMDAWCPLSYQVAKVQAHAYVFCDIDRFAELRSRMQAAGWYVFRTPLVVYKLNSGRVPLPDRGPRRQYELVLYAIKGNRTVTQIFSDVIPSQADDNMTHGAQKPVAVYQNLLQRSVRPGDTVLDSFGGSGTLIPAAHSMQCRAILCEKEPEYYGMCLNRWKTIKEKGEVDILSGLQTSV